MKRHQPDDQMVLRAQERLKRRNQGQKSGLQSSQTSTPSTSTLETPLHPLLRNMHTPTATKNPLKQNVRKAFDPLLINPYLSSGTTAHRRALQFNPRGKYIAQAEEIRRKQAEDRRQQQILEEKRKNKLIPDEATAEIAYKQEMPPPVEWWDEPYLRDYNYDHIADAERIVTDNEASPVSKFIQHPVLLDAMWSKHMPQEQKPMYLTKAEQKRIRRNERLARLKDKQDRIKLGLEAPPPPKVKLSNLMNVLTNEAIKDPTAIEKRVRREVDQRLQAHLEENERRKLTPEQRHEKIEAQHEKDLQKGYFTTVYKIHKLVDSRHIYKVDINAKQLGLVGMCLINPGYNVVIVEGGHKAIAFYKKLLTKRIDWKQSDQDDLADNLCEIVWEGQLSDLGFQRWSVHKPRDVQDGLDLLTKFGRDNYLREVLSKGKE